MAGPATRNVDSRSEAASGPSISRPPHRNTCRDHGWIFEVSTVCSLTRVSFQESSCQLKGYLQFRSCHGAKLSWPQHGEVGDDGSRASMYLRCSPSRPGRAAWAWTATTTAAQPLTTPSSCSSSRCCCFKHGWTWDFLCLPSSGRRRRDRQMQPSVGKMAMTLIPTLLGWSLTAPLSSGVLRCCLRRWCRQDKRWTLEHWGKRGRSFVRLFVRLG